MKRLSPIGTFVEVVPLISLLLLPGCGKNEDATYSPPPVAHPKLQEPPLQAELDRLYGIPHEHDPKKRRPVISDRAENRREWLLRALERGYAETGHTNSQSAGAAHKAFEAYADYARVSPSGEHYATLTNSLIAAASAGCDDPMIQYMRVRYGLDGSKTSNEEIALAYLKAFRVTFESHYHPVFKFFAGYRAIYSARTADKSDDRSPLIEMVTGTIEDLVRDTNAPAAEVFEPLFTWVDYSRSGGWVDYLMTDVQKSLDLYWSGEEPYFRFLGLAEINRAWGVRGTGFANTVEAKGWEGFKEHLDKAEVFLNKAWQMNSTNAYTAYLMMKVELGQGKGRARMEQWFQRAMALAPDYYDAADLMSFYLEPRWYGSEDAALGFARSCVTSTKWGGTVPMVLPSVYHSLARYHKQENAPEYWRRPQVWQDIHAAYEKFFKLSPEPAGWREKYARDAYLCGHYAEFLDQAKLFGGYTNYPFFGGKDVFERMLAHATMEKQ